MSMYESVSHTWRPDHLFIGTVYHDLYLSGKALEERENEEDPIRARRADLRARERGTSSSDIKMGLDVADTLCFQLGRVMKRMTWRQFILALGLHYEEEMAEAGFGAYWYGSERVIPDKGDLRDYWMKILSDKDFLGPDHFYVYIRDHVRRLCHRMIAYSIFGRGQGRRRHAEGRKNGASFQLLIYMSLLGSTSVQGLAIRPKRQQVVAVGAPGAAEDAPAADEGVERINRLEEEVRELRQSAVGLRGVVESSITEQSRVSTWMISCMSQLLDASGRTYQAFDSTLFGSSRLSY
ncbi:hypothetical protein Tco_0950579 [Tanacetum coccineum]